jgi:hypothetical protein
MFHMTNDSGLFKTTDELAAEGAYPVTGHRWRHGKQMYLPLYEGKMIDIFDHRAASIRINSANIQHAAIASPTTLDQHTSTSYHPSPQFWVDAAHVHIAGDVTWSIAFRDVTNVNNWRTTIAALVPFAGFGNTAPLLVPASTEPASDIADVEAYKLAACVIVANLNSFIYDYIARQKIQNWHLNWYIMEQLPVIAPATVARAPHGRKLQATILRDVLHLTYTCEDMAPFARDMGYDGPPFRWDEEDRRHRRARLDAIYFHLYGIGRDDAAYILDTFPIVRREYEEKFVRYLTKDLILAYMNAVAAGDMDTVVSG